MNEEFFTKNLRSLENRARSLICGRREYTRVHVKRLLDWDELNMTCMLARECVPWIGGPSHVTNHHSMRQVCCVLTDDVTDHQAPRSPNKATLVPQRCNARSPAVRSIGNGRAVTVPFRSSGQAVQRAGTACMIMPVSPSTRTRAWRGVFGPPPRSASFVVRRSH
jgi:hypothetical protein